MNKTLFTSLLFSTAQAQKPMYDKPVLLPWFLAPWTNRSEVSFVVTTDVILNLLNS